jgi:hypothetical protein
MLLRTRPIEPCLPSPAEKPPSGSGWLHEIKHDGFRLMARRDAARVRLLTRNGHDWSYRFPLICDAVKALRVRSCLLDGEAIAFEDDGVASFELLRHRRHDRLVTLCAFDLLEFDGTDLRRETLERRTLPCRAAEKLHSNDFCCRAAPRYRARAERSRAAEPFPPAGIGSPCRRVGSLHGRLGAAWSQPFSAGFSISPRPPHSPMAC